MNRRQLVEQWQRLDVTVRDLSLGLGLLVATFVPGFRTHGTQLGELPDRPFDALAAVALALESLPLALRRRWPAGCLALVSLGFALDQVRGYHAPAGTGLAVALLSAGIHLDRHRRATALTLSVAYLPLAFALSRLGRGAEPPEEFLTFYLALVMAWGIGAWLRATRVAEAERRRRVAEVTRTAERTRIARELHDVVTHHVTAMVVQTEAARYLTATPQRLDRTLTAVTDTGRRAITDLRHLLDLLNPDHDTGPRTGRGPRTGDCADADAGTETGTRAPVVGRMRTLVEQTRRAGQPVEFTEEGVPAESTGSADLVAYRVVQEALTNAIKHAHGSPTSVRVRHTGKEITVEVGTAGAGPTDAGTGSTGSTGTAGTGAPVKAAGWAGSGRGLVGLRERVVVLGGDFRAGREAGGGFVVRARIPASGTGGTL